MNCQIAFLDAALSAKYVFPFWDPSWKVRFIVIDVFGAPGPRVFVGPIEARDRGLVTSGSAEEARPLPEFPPSSFDGLFHFDPWWVFRGTVGLGKPHRDAIVRTNVAHSFREGGVTWKVHDAEYGPRTESLESIVAEDNLYRKKRFTKTTLDLASHFGGGEGAATGRQSERSDLWRK